MVHEYRKGYVAELELVHVLSKRGFMVIRAPRSGRIGLSSPDIVAVKKGRVVVIECKSRKAGFRVDNEQMEELKEWKEKAGADTYVAWKISYRGWFFFELDDVIKNNGNIGKKFCEKHALKIDEIL